MQFTYSAYKEVLAELQNNQYTFAQYHNHHLFDKSVILRHDVDLSPGEAVAFAHIESSLAVKSTYFFLLSSNLYNLASKECLEAVHEVHRMGHEVGLHFDESKYFNDEGFDPLFCAHVQCEAAQFEAMTGIPARSFSMHQPSSVSIKKDYCIEGLVNAYSKPFLDDYYYMSDSRRQWRVEPLHIIKSGKEKKLHLLTHPYWYNEAEKSLHDSLVKYVRDSAERDYRLVVDGVDDYRKAFSKDEYSRMFDHS